MISKIPLLIIGAGPAGLSTALHLLKTDPTWKDRMVLIDRASHPRHKLCGGGVTQYGLHLLKELDIPVPLPIPHAVVRDARFVYKKRIVHVRGNPEIAIFHRAEFDHYLAQEVKNRGVKIHENERVRSIDRHSDGVTVITDKGQYLAQAVVGADGSKGLTRTLLKNNIRRTRVARLMESVHPASENAPQFNEEYALFDFTPVKNNLQGYVWDFPARVQNKAHHNRGIYDSRVAYKRPKAGLPKMLDHSLSQMGSEPDEIKVEGHPIRWFSPRSIMSGDRLLLVGDAAGAEPLFGEGIAPALGYGKVAAAVIDQSFTTKDFTFKTYKKQVLFSRLGFYMLLRWYVAWWSYRLSDKSWFMHIMWTIGRGLAVFKRGNNDKTPDPANK